jgi:hypothetical protein
MLGKVVDTDQRNWDEWLPSVMAAYRASKHDATGYSPNFLMLGREVNAPLDIMYGTPTGEEEHYESCDDFVDKKINIMRRAHQLARDHLGYAASRSKRLYDMRVRPSQYRVGQWVYYYCPRKYTGRSPKWQRLYTGPFLIVREMGPVNMQLQASPRAHPFVSHIDKLKPCLASTPKSWVTADDPPRRNEKDRTIEVPTDAILEDLRFLEEHEPENLLPLQDEFTLPEEAEIQQPSRPRRMAGRPQRYRD